MSDHFVLKCLIIAGVIGLCAAYALLKETRDSLNVALIERNDTIPGRAIGHGSATGAGVDAYIQLVKKSCLSLYQMMHPEPGN